MSRSRTNPGRAIGMRCHSPLPRCPVHLSDSNGDGRRRAARYTAASVARAVIVCGAGLRATRTVVRRERERNKGRQGDASRRRRQHPWYLDWQLVRRAQVQHNLSTTEASVKTEI